MSKEIIEAARALYAARKGYLNPQAPMDLWVALGAALGEDTSWSAPHAAHDDEEWRPLPGFPAYHVSENGRVRRAVAGRYKRGSYGPGRVLKGGIGTHGYPVVNIRVAGRQHVILVHRAVCEAFHGPAPKDKTWVAHRDDNKLNPRKANLRWASPAENWQDGLLNGRNHVGDGAPAAKLTWARVHAIRAARAEGALTKDLARAHGVSRSLVSMVINGKIWLDESSSPKSMQRLQQL